MPLLRLAVLKRRLIAGTAAALAVLLAGVAVLVTGQSASSAPVGVGPAPAPTVVARAAASAAADAGDVVLSRTLVVLGDSISARFTDTTGDELQGWWSMLGDRVGAEPMVRAEGGSGFVNPGEVGCVGHTLHQQLATPEVLRAVAAAGVVVVEGGRTDTQTCAEVGAWDDFRPVGDDELRAAVETFMGELARVRGADARCTAVVVPWGPKGGTANRDRVTAIVHEVSTAHGFTFVDTEGLLTTATTMEDGVHPNREGNRLLMKALVGQGLAGDCVA